MTLFRVNLMGEITGQPIPVIQTRIGVSANEDCGNGARIERVDWEFEDL